MADIIRHFYFDLLWRMISAFGTIRPRSNGVKNTSPYRNKGNHFGGHSGCLRFPFRLGCLILLERKME
jgi:hypothetical protein